MAILPPSTVSIPGQAEPFRVWADRTPGFEVRFVGRGPAMGPDEALRSIVPPPAPAVGWLQQIHSARVLAGASGLCGEGDAMWTAEPGLALVVKTADCVPVLLAGEGHVAAVHAGWRGIVQEIIPRAVAVLPVAPAVLTAWIGPAIGPCCYEVGEEVAEAVALASSPAIAIPGPAGKPHLDLSAAAEVQLRRLGVTEIRRFEVCTRCHGEWLHSFRREREAAGRNYAFIWLTGLSSGRRVEPPSTGSP